MKWCISPTSLTLSCVLFSWVCAPAVRSQVIPDGTLPVPTQVTPDALDANKFNINGGTQAGSNLFHSFREFSVPSGSEAFFNNAADVQNIFSRVTGGSVSDIQGVIRANVPVNLFLLNPAGIVFGPNARLDIGGSFFGSTADSVVFSDNVAFSATDTNPQPLLTINVPIGLQFGPTPGDIQVQGNGVNRPFLDNPTVGDRIVRERALLDLDDFDGSFGGLRVSPGRTLGLVGGNITFSGGLIQAPEGRIELGGVGAGSRVDIGNLETGFPLSYTSVQNFQDIGLAERAGVFATGDKGGDIQVIGRNLTLTGGSEITALTVGSQAGGVLTVNASETISLVEGTNFLVSGTFGSGNSGNVTVNANTSILLRDGSQIGAATQGAGRAGDITLNTGQLILQEGSRVDSFTTEIADIADNPTNHAGKITVTASQSAEFNGTSADGQISGGLFARTDGTGNAGQVTIMTPSLRILNGAIVAAFTKPNSTGDAGNITVSNANLVELSGNSQTGGISRLTAVTEGSGNAGKVTIDTQQLLVQDGGEVSAFTASDSTGNAGEITIDATESVTISGISSGGINSSVLALTRGTGRAGNVRITTPQFIARDGGQVETLTTGSTTQTNADGSIVNRAGEITITASELVELSGTADFTGPITDEDILNSGLIASTEGTGDAGTITINTPKLKVQDEAVVVTSTEGSGNAGNIAIQPPEGVELESSRVELLEGGALVTGTSSEAIAGNVEIDTGRFVARDGSLIITVTGGSGQAGEIEIDASDSVKIDDSFLLAGTLGSGMAGNIEINTGQFKLTDEAALIVASFDLEEANGVGEAGTIEIEAERIFQENEGSLLAFSFLGRGGNIILDAEETRLEGLSNVLAFGLLTQEGNIDITSDRLLLFRDGSRVITRDADPKGGNINVETRDEPLLLLYRCNTCIISASGTLTIADELPTPELAFTPILDVNSLIREDVCKVGVGSEFIIPGSGGIPPSPLEPFSGSALTAIDWIEFPPENIATIPQSENETSEEDSQLPEYKPLVEAQGWIVAENGQIILVANSPTVTPAVPALNRIDCTDE